MKAPMITVLYEDSLEAKPNNYGPHLLVLTCVTDRIGGDPYALQRSSIRGFPRNSSSKIRKDLKQNGERLARSGPVVAMFDNDRIHRCYGLRKGVCRPQLLETIRAESSGDPIIVLLEENMEDVVKACCEVMSIPAPEDKPSPGERDRLLHRMARSDPRKRQSLCEIMPTFERLVRTIQDLLLPPAP